MDHSNAEEGYSSERCKGYFPKRLSAVLIATC